MTKTKTVQEEVLSDETQATIDWEAEYQHLQQENTQYVNAYNAEKQAHEKTKIKYERLLELFNVFIDKYLSK